MGLITTEASLPCCAEMIIRVFDCIRLLTDIPNTYCPVIARSGQKPDLAPADDGV
jgi:hypothetical protein